MNRLQAFLMFAMLIALTVGAPFRPKPALLAIGIPHAQAALRRRRPLPCSMHAPSQEAPPYHPRMLACPPPSVRSHAHLVPRAAEMAPKADDAAAAPAKAGTAPVAPFFPMWGMWPWMSWMWWP